VGGEFAGTFRSSTNGQHQRWCDIACGPTLPLRRSRNTREQRGTVIRKQLNTSQQLTNRVHCRVKGGKGIAGCRQYLLDYFDDDSVGRLDNRCRDGADAPGRDDRVHQRDSFNQLVHGAGCRAGDRTEKAGMFSRTWLAGKCCIDRLSRARSNGGSRGGKGAGDGTDSGFGD
jgi:hypothetical protein